MDVSVIIVNYNTKVYLSNCLESIYKNTKDVKFEIIVSDNGSTDGSIEMLKKSYPQVRLIENNENLGFGKANNVAAKKANGKYILFLNSDTVLLNNSLKYFFEYAEKMSKPGIIGSWLIDSENQPMPSYGKFTTFDKQLLIYLYDFFPLLLKIRLFLKPRKSNLINEKPFVVDFVTGADLFIPLDIFNEIGGFDESFFMYHEDDDLCRRALINGYKSILISDPKIVHFEGKSLCMSKKKILIREQSFLTYLKKYETSVKFEFDKKVYNLFVTVRYFINYLSLKEKNELYDYTKKYLNTL